MKVACPLLLSGSICALDNTKKAKIMKLRLFSNWLTYYASKVKGKENTESMVYY